MPDEDEMERRIWRTMRWDADIMTPNAESDAEDERREDAERDGMLK